jgi:hypothetical protein
MLVDSTVLPSDFDSWLILVGLFITFVYMLPALPFNMIDGKLIWGIPALVLCWGFLINYFISIKLKYNAKKTKCKEP